MEVSCLNGDVSEVSPGFIKVSILNVNCGFTYQFITLEWIIIPQLYLKLRWTRKLCLELILLTEGWIILITHSILGII
jgi:hypothetical protein